MEASIVYKYWGLVFKALASQWPMTSPIWEALGTMRSYLIIVLWELAPMYLSRVSSSPLHATAWSETWDTVLLHVFAMLFLSLLLRGCHFSQEAIHRLSYFFFSRSLPVLQMELSWVLQDPGCPVHHSFVQDVYNR